MKLCSRREANNSKDRFAVAVYKDDTVVGHVPYNIAPRLSQFLNREVNKGLICRSDRRKAKQRGWIRTGDSLCLSTIWPESVRGQDEGINRYSKRDRTGLS